MGNPKRLVWSGRLLDEIATNTSDASDRNIDFLVHQRRSKLDGKWTRRRRAQQTSVFTRHYEQS